MVRVGVGVGVEVSVSVGFLVGARVEDGPGVKVEMVVGSWVAAKVLVGKLTEAGAEVASVTEPPGGVLATARVDSWLLQLVNSTKELNRINKPNILLEMSITLLLD
jgi:hypothetical protein